MWIFRMKFKLNRNFVWKWDPFFSIWFNFIHSISKWKGVENVYWNKIYSNNIVRIVREWYKNNTLKFYHSQDSTSNKHPSQMGLSMGRSNTNSREKKVGLEQEAIRWESNLYYKTNEGNLQISNMISSYFIQQQSGRKILNNFSFPFLYVRFIQEAVDWRCTIDIWWNLSLETFEYFLSFSNYMNV